MKFDPPALRSLTGTAVRLPMKRPLGTSARSINEACLLLLDLLTEDGVAGHAYAFCYQPSIARSLVPIVAELSAQLAGHSLVPLDLAHAVSRYFRLPGVTGPLAMVASSVDTAAWDALAKGAGMPLATYLGAARHPIPAYNSNGLGLMAPVAAADEAEALLEGGFTGVKLRLGRSHFEHDLATVRAVRKRLPDAVRLMVDFNQALTSSDAMTYALALDQEGVYWIEEPTRHDDYRHMARIAQAVQTPIQIGENFNGLAPMAAALEADASDYVMLDLDRIGGVTGWQRAAGLAAAYGREVSSHLFPEVSAHLMAATPGRHWLEYVDWANPILQEPLVIKDGMAIISDRPGNGLAWNDDVLAKYRLD
ncbi:enolase C-terminal domain-like protein [Bradyrhizobium elkanii]|uniref:enolase C-terminal domain-like protein n=1 Tax=Bradyrhizobium elkanii TaxID=29448 RepID=UPI00216A46B9|nr:enolase C-terminal domain-like protein [Bradyrhizobium elkanii]MCS3474156.1 mandelate racemase [Bradyrhizobium elkanii]